MRGTVKGGELDQGSNSVKRNGMPVLDITEHKIFSYNVQLSCKHKNSHFDGSQ